VRPWIQSPIPQNKTKQNTIRQTTAKNKWRSLAGYSKSETCGMEEGSERCDITGLKMEEW
jgi:hypothetical protein